MSSITIHGYRIKYIQTPQIVIQPPRGGMQLYTAEEIDGQIGGMEEKISDLQQWVEVFREAKKMLAVLAQTEDEGKHGTSRSASDVAQAVVASQAE